MSIKICKTVICRQSTYGLIYSEEGEQSMAEEVTGGVHFGQNNIMLVTLSAIYPGKFERGIYTTEGDPVDGCFTNEAPAKYLIRCLYESLYTFFDRIIVLASSECMGIIPGGEKIPAIDGLTTAAYFEHALLDYMKQLDPSMYHLRFDEEKGKGLFYYVDAGVNEADIGRLIDTVSVQEENPWDANIYMDFTGGPRPESLLGLMVMRCLDERGYNIRKVIYSYYSGKKEDDSNTRGQIVDITHIYRMFDAVVASSRLSDENYAGIHEDEALKLVQNGFPFDTASWGGCRDDALEFAKAYDGEEPYIFLSYSHLDMMFAQSFLKNLQRRGISRIWYDDGILPAERWEDKIIEKLRNCSCFIVLGSRHYVSSLYCRKELRIALEKADRPVLCILLDMEEEEFLGSLDGEMDPRQLEEIGNVQAVFYRKLRTDTFYEKIMRAKGIDRFKN